MPETLTLTVDKFTFQVPGDRLYTANGVWVMQEGALVRVGLSDYLQQRSGDVAFTEIQLAGTKVQAGEEFGVVETIKVNLSLESPVSGEIVEVNPALETASEVINQDPYGAGWVALLRPESWAADQARLMEARTYFAKIQAEAEEEAKNQ